jgi:hypothetical protein
METVELVLYQIDELSEKARQKAIDNNRDWNVDGFDWWCNVYDDYKRELEERGFFAPEIWFSGFCSQGDGACFDAQIDLNELLNWVSDKSKYRHLVPFIEDGTIHASIEKNSYGYHYSHERTRYIELEHPFWKERCPRSASLCKELQEELEEIRYDLSHKIYRSLEKDYEWLTSDECVEESLKTNEVRFLENGEVYRF